ncbi:MAG: beta galactosidase jelly roll domain-containing protein [Ignavibacteriales bacterium]|nr:beta galactosidase jelly roll domain-containing protein [Ignavibacteriales bacterium]
MKVFLLLLSMVSLINISYGSEKKIFLEIPSLFSNNMVLQQKSDVPFWGKATPGLRISFDASWGRAAKTIVKDDSTWFVKIKTPKAGGPYKIDLQIGDSTINFSNVLIGEVWLCSGQSNMEMPLRGWPPSDTISFSAQSIRDADYPNLRFFTVVRAYSERPEQKCSGIWSECTHATAEGFSATAFFLGRKLMQELKIPIGLIHSSWGGTPAEAWTGEKYLAEIEQFKDIIKKLDDGKPEIVKLNRWIRNHPIIDISKKNPQQKWKELDFGDSVCSISNYDDSKWNTMNLPTQWESTEVGDFDGVIWFRKQINISKNWLNKDLILEIGKVDDMDITFVNGVKVGSYEEDGFWQTERVYNVPAEIVKDTLITIAVRVLDNQGGGGIWGPKEKMKLSLKEERENISLSGEWKYLPVAQYIADNFYVFGTKEDEYLSRPKLSLSIGPSTPTVLYNGMISPLIPYKIKGVIWYQGESNVANPELYKIIFPTMIRNWRNDWKERSFPFYYVQIAPWIYDSGSQSQKLREAQLVTLSVPKTGMVVTLDIGSPNTIHPPDKENVGERLALWALAKDYNKRVVYSGPIYKSMKVKKDKIILTFDHIGKGFILKEKESQKNFLIAEEDKIFKEAELKIVGKNLIVSSPGMKAPVAVRYGWSNYVDASLFNKEGLPASSFRTDNWEN